MIYKAGLGPTSIFACAPYLVIFTLMVNQYSHASPHDLPRVFAGCLNISPVVMLPITYHGPTISLSQRVFGIFGFQPSVEALIYAS